MITFRGSEFAVVARRCDITCFEAFLADFFDIRLSIRNDQTGLLFFEGMIEKGCIK